MNERLKLPLLLCCFSLSVACSGAEYAMQTYSDTEVVKFSSQGKAWRIFDKPQDRIMMVTPGVGDAVAAGVAEGITFGTIGNQSAPVTYFRLAALEFLESTGRTCTITSTREVMDPQWEFTYECNT